MTIVKEISRGFSRNSMELIIANSMKRFNPFYTKISEDEYIKKENLFCDKEQNSKFKKETQKWKCL